MSLRQINRQKTRLAILDAARSLATDSAWYSITTRQIAEAAQVSYQTLYNYFPSKAEIVRALIVETYVGPEEDMLNIIKGYEDDLLGSINKINAARFKSRFARASVASRRRAAARSESAASRWRASSASSRRGETRLCGALEPSRRGAGLKRRAKRAWSSSESAFGSESESESESESASESERRRPPQQPAERLSV